jgi:hypothetical protein
MASPASAYKPRGVAVTVSPPAQDMARREFQVVREPPRGSTLITTPSTRTIRSVTAVSARMKGWNGGLASDDGTNRECGRPVPVSANPAGGAGLRPGGSPWVHQWPKGSELEQGVARPTALPPRRRGRMTAIHSEGATMALSVRPDHPDGGS